LATAPPATRPTVSRPLARPAPHQSPASPYFRKKLLSACPGLISSLTWRYWSMWMSCVSTLRINSPTGAPVVTPSNIPLTTSTRSVSSRGESSLLWPGRRLSSSFWIIATSSLMPDGTPLTMANSAPP